ncbi:carboxylic acid reductase [Mycobacterium avium]|uniref:carboxylic acid reductase n=1 Tax=Mycobacterium avium TaxID=1764 RepID=UPI001CC39E5D|nr:carboxylic acid reductase [Mycobacterium avium]MBZ4535746.1 AMP-binding protein [Mycobacterium avium subsp. hominissuis]MBZ4592973.1 AMP-binding protein [Mycobacterium avium subsp. hominissuis]MBZ4635946.1 AMP-binding protein [Mycobacterium avium subsp. hominissuis]
MAASIHSEPSNLPGLSETRSERLAHRIARLYASDPEFRAAKPLPAVIAAARRPGLRLAEILQTLIEGYSDRPALGQRSHEVVPDPAAGRTTTRLLPGFDTISYGDLWTRVRAVAAAWRRDEAYPVSPGQFVATVGFAGPDYLTIDLVCAYLGLVSVPLQHNAPVSILKPIIDETEPRVLAAGVAYLDLAVESALESASLRHLVVFDYQPQIDGHRENLERARRRLYDAGKPVVVSTMHELIERGRQLPPEPLYTGDTDERLAMILYTSGSTGTPKGAMLTERMLTRMWTSPIIESETPVFNVNFFPLNHIAGRFPLIASFLAGGTSYFVAESDLSTLFDDWALARPTELLLVPRVVEMLFQHYRSTVDRLALEDFDVADAESEAAVELRELVLGGRVLRTFVSTAPLAAELRAFLESCLDVHVGDLYGLTEVVPVTKDGIIVRPSVIDYKLIDVPELGYFTTDKPYPRGELLVKSENSTPGYYKRPEVTAEAFDEHGYYRTGDVMAEVAPDHLVYVDRRKNVVKLANGEFVAVANLEAVFSTAPLVRQIFVYGNSERSYLLAVIVPTAEALSRFDDSGALKAALRESLQQTAKTAELQSYEVPADFLIETEPFSPANGLLSGIGKNLRPKLKDAYGARLEELYTELAAAQVGEMRALRRAAGEQPLLDTVIGAARVVLGSPDDNVDANAHFTDLGGDSLSALTFSNLLQELLGVEVSVGVIVSPATDLRQIAEYIEAERLGSARPTFAKIHGKGETTVYASDLVLDRFIDAETLTAAKTLPRATGEPHTVLLTGANGYLGRFVTLEWLERFSRTGGKLITIIRGTDVDAARARLEKSFDSGDPELLRRFRELAAEHLEVITGDIGEPNLGLDHATWERLAHTTDLIAHVGALVNHVLPYEQLFGPNVVGTAEVIKLAISAQIKPITFMSTVAVAAQIAPDDFVEDGDIRVISPKRAIDDSYANGYGNSKWAAEVLLREAFDLCGLPVAVFRSDMILAHSRYVGQLNVTDNFTRLLFSLLVTGIAPGSFYQTDAAGKRARSHYAGLPADFVAEAVTTLGKQVTDGLRSFDVENPHDDGISLDTFVDWLIDAGHKIQRVEDYDEWITRFETALKALPEKQRQQSVLPLLGAYRKPEQPLRGAPTPTEVFQTAVQAAKIGADKDIPHLSAALIDKYVTDLEHLGLL